MATFTVVIVNWNGLQYLPRCLGSVRNQQRQPEEIIFVDNGSTDDSVACVKSDFPEMRLVALEQNIGFAQANNMAARQATGEWLLLLNPDAFAEPDWLLAFEKAIAQHPQAISFTGLLLQEGEKGLVDGAGDVYHYSGLAWRKDHGKPLSTSNSRAGQVFSACGASALYRRDVFLEQGGFDEDFFCYMEDVDLGFRLLLGGHACQYVPEARAVHVGSGITGKRSEFSIYHGHRNLEWVYLKNMPGMLFWLYLPAHLLLIVVSIVLFVFRGHGKTIIKSKWHALLKTPLMLRKRKVIQQQRKAKLKDINRIIYKGW